MSIVGTITPDPAPSNCLVCGTPLAGSRCLNCGTDAPHRGNAATNEELRLLREEVARLREQLEKVKDWPWVDALEAHPPHGLSVNIIPEGGERIAIGFWDKELADKAAQYVVDGPNGSHQVRALWWSHLPAPPTRKRSAG